jgi:peptide/nickel transport system substrate-binding protein
MRSDRNYWETAARARVSRRRVLATGAAVTAGSAAIVVVGCGKGSKKPPSDQPLTGGTLRTGTTLPIASGIDPQIETGTGLEIFPRIYGYLFHVDPQDAVVNDHAASIEQPDPMTVVVKLRSDLCFQAAAPVAGRAVSAQDAAESILRYRDNPLVTSKTWHTTVLDTVGASDATTLRVSTRRPYVYTLRELGGIGAGAILPKELIEAKTDISATSIGSGPFQLDRIARTTGARIVRSDSYYRRPVPYLDAMEWTIFPNDDTKLAAFKARNIDVIPNHDSAEAQMFRDASNGVDVTSEPSLACVSLGLRVDRPPFNDPRVRGALDLAIDRDALIRDLAFGNGEVLGAVNPHLAGGFWSLPNSDVLAAHSGTVSIDERRSGARALLEAAGAAGASFKLQVANIPLMIDVATVVRQQLLTLGLDIVMEELDLIVWFTNFRRGQFDATIISHLPYESPDTPTRFFHSAGPDGTASMFGFNDGAIDQLIERSWGEADRATRQNTLLDAQRLMLYARPMIQLFTSTGYTTARKSVRNRHGELLGSDAQYNYEQWIAPA